MDAVRFGRALGVGARSAVKTLTTAVDAATAENPSARRTASRPASQTASQSASQSGSQSPTRPTASAAAPVHHAARVAARTVVKGRQTKSGLARGGKRFGEAVWGPFARLGGVLGLEVSGVFFGIFAIFGLAGIWRFRAQWHAGGAQREDLVGAVVMAALFGYFCVSSFIRARRRERKR